MPSTAHLATRTGSWYAVVSNSHGAALLTAIIVAGLASFLAMAMIGEQQLAIRRAANSINSDQAYVLTRGIEEWGGHLLVRDARDNQKDSLGEPWAMGLPPLTSEGATLYGRIEDLDGRLNLNNMLAPNRELRDFSFRQFQRLLSICKAPDVSPELRSRFAMDSLTGEKDTPQSSLRMASPTELLLLPGLQAEDMDHLAPYVCALPTPTMININTAPAPVIAALDDNISLDQARAIVDARPGDGYASVAQFLALPELAGSAIKDNFLTLASSFFMVHSEATVGRGHIRLTSLLQRSSTNYHVFIRSLGSI